MCAAPQLLVSVRNVDEAQAALRGGADVIDIKEPTAGPLGMASRETITSITEAVHPGRPVTAALGEWHEHDADAPTALPDVVRYCKLGLASAEHDPSQTSMHWRDHLDTHLATHGAARFVAVAYADAPRVGAPSVDAVLRWATSRRPVGLLIDTAVKDGRALLDWCAIAQLRECIEAVHAYSGFVALAGSLDVEAAMRVAALGADLVAVRGAVCGQYDRRGAVRADAVRQLKASLHKAALDEAALDGDRDSRTAAAPGANDRLSSG